MKKGRIFLQYGFWKTIKRTDVSIFGPNAWDLFCVLRSRILRAEIPIEFFGQDDLLNILWHESGGSCFVEDGYIDNILENEELSKESLCSVFLVDKDEDNSGMLTKHGYLISGKTLPFDFHENGSFYDLKMYFSHPCNSLALIDPHILKERAYINHHIKPLLKNIIPESWEIPFHVSIFSGIGQINDAKLGESYYDDLLTMLHEIRPGLDFSLTVYQIPIQGEGWHARYVITNNLMIHATEGFDFFGPVGRVLKAKKAGKFIVNCPWLDKNNDLKEYSIWINKTAIESAKGNGYHHERWGAKENRLFDLAD